MEPGIVFDDFRKSQSYDIYCLSEIGKRESQQDCAYVAANDHSIIAVICDGMGGYEGGELASQTAVEAFLDFYQCYGDDSSLNHEWMRCAVDKIDRIVYDISDAAGNRMGAGTTMVALHFKEKYLSWISVGDSRAYIFRNSEMGRLTNDHNYFLELNQKLDAGLITKVEYQEEASRGDALISFVGMGGLSLIDTNSEPFNLCKGDTIIACTDGIYRMVSDSELQRIVLNSSSSEEIGRAIHSTIVQKQSLDQDNYTCAIIKIN